jgi:hypothetical protein
VRFLMTSLAPPLAAGGQQAAKTYKISVLSADSRESVAPRFLPKQLGELGYVEGQNLQIEWRFADGNIARLPDLAADLLRFKVAVGRNAPTGSPCGRPTLRSCA